MALKGMSMLRLLALSSLILIACSADPKPAMRGTDPLATPGGAAGSPGVIDIPVPECPPSNPFCTTTPLPPSTSTGTGTTSTVCEDVPLDLTPAGINIMLGVDGSASMMSHWPAIQTAIRSLVKSNPSAQFGVQLFWGDAADVLGTMPTMNMSNNVCAEIHNKVLDVGTHSADEMVQFIGTAPPGPTAFGGVLEISPLIDPLNYYLTNATALADPKRTNYLVLVSDGNDNCFGSYFVSSKDKLVAYQKLATELLKQNIRVIPVGFNSASMTDQANPFGSMIASTTDLDVLGTLLEYGGKVLPEVPKVDDPSKLAEVITQVGQSISNCRFVLPPSLDPNAGANPFELSFSINGVTLPRDRHGTSGWEFAIGSTSQVELYGQGCEAVRSGQPVQAHKSCAKDICGTSAVQVQTRDRAVLLLLDSSASRIECTDDSLDCLSLPGTAGRPLTFWETVQQAVGTTLNAAVNDDVEFGMQFFPSKTAEALSCTVETQPEFPSAQGTEISIMKGMLEKLPFGFSPVVQIIENVAANPGRLADPSVLGSVVLLSDGGDNCSGDDEATIVGRISAAAKKLLDLGIKTYAVRYGSEAGRTPEGEEQLRALVTSGGTAQVDPNDPTGKPYIDARNADELGAALANISDRLATCSFALTGLPSKESEKDNANLYLNGEAIPFDKLSTRQNGWNWLDATRTGVELYGDSCNAFKTNRHTSIVVEFGCPPVELL